MSVVSTLIFFIVSETTPLVLISLIKLFLMQHSALIQQQAYSNFSTLMQLSIG